MKHIVLFFTLATSACAGTPPHARMPTIIERPAPPEAPAMTEGDLPIMWTGGVVGLSDGPLVFTSRHATLRRLTALDGLGSRLVEGRAVAVRCRRLSPEPVYVRFTPLSAAPADAWAGTVAAWSPRQLRDFPGPGWERGCHEGDDAEGDVGLLLDDGWVGDAAEAELVAAAWPWARPWADGVPIFLPGRAWIDIPGEVRATLQSLQGDRLAAAKALVLTGSCRAALIGAEWLASSHRTDPEVTKAAFEFIESQYSKDTAAPPRDALLAVLLALSSAPPEDLDPPDPRWRDNPLFLVPTRNKRLGGQGTIRGLARGNPIDPVAWGDACDAIE